MYGTVVTALSVLLLALIVAYPAVWLVTLPWLVLFGLWVLGRRASQGAELMALTGDRRWLSLAWAPTLLLPVQFAAAFVAVLTVRKQPAFDYKGPRVAGTT